MVIDLTKFVLPPAGMIICQLNPTIVDSDFTSHVTPIHDDCSRIMHDDYMKLKGHGIATNTLIVSLLREYPADHVHTVIRLLAKFGLLVPIFVDAESSSSSGSLQHSTTSIIPGVEEYVVPAQLPPLSSESADAGDQWIDLPYKTCVLWFSTVRPSHNQSWLTSSHMYQAGFISPGIFQRLVAMMIVYCQSAIDVDKTQLDLESIKLYEDLVILKIAGQYFRIKLLKELNALQLDVTGERLAATVLF